MREIYPKASEVRVWLGPATPTTEKGFDLLRHIVNDTIDFDMEFAPAREAYFVALQEIFDNPYWLRRWITQEIFLTQRIFLHSGRSQVGPVDLRERGIWVYVHEYYRFVRPTWRTQPYLFFEVVMRAIEAMWNALKAPDFEHPKLAVDTLALNRFFQAQASNDHDYVYALLGLLPEDMRGIIPNYELPLRDVYADFAFRFMTCYNAVQFLYLAGYNVINDDLPTWVPDLRNQVYGLENRKWGSYGRT
jgi:hypothetical protein